MGMTNDDTLTGLYALREFLKHSEFEGLEEQTKAQIQIVTDAIDIMRKYQKIRQIINYPVYIQEDVLRYKMICEVVGKKNITHGTYEGENRGGN